MNISENLQQYSESLLNDNLVECIIGYQAGPRGTTRPVFLDHPSKTTWLVWNQDCSQNLTVYLRQKLKETEGKVGIVVKPCDSKTINMLSAENRVDRTRLHVIGVDCQGILDRKTKQDSGSMNFQDRCLKCEMSEPIGVDHFIGEPRERNGLSGLEDVDSLSLSLESASPEIKLNYWLSEFDRCIRCYACRQVCPLCDCPTCLFEREDSTWTGNGSTVKDNRTYHLGRAFHLAGRCIGCGECQRVCPMDINLGELNKVLAREMEKQFNHRAGFKAELSPITTILGERR